MLRHQKMRCILSGSRTPFPFPLTETCLSRKPRHKSNACWYLYFKKIYHPSLYSCHPAPSSHLPTFPSSCPSIPISGANPSFSQPALLCLSSFCIIFRFSFLNIHLSFLPNIPYNFLPSPFSLSLGWHILTPSLWLSRHVKSCSQVLDSLSGQKKILGKSVDRCSDYGSVWTRMTSVSMVPDGI